MTRIRQSERIIVHRVWCFIIFMFMILLDDICHVVYSQVTTTSDTIIIDDDIDALIDMELLSSLNSTLNDATDTDTTTNLNNNIIVDDDDDSDEVISLDDSSTDVDTTNTTQTTFNDTTVHTTNTTNESTTTKPEMIVESNLESMSDDELIAICKQRGYEISIENDGSRTNNTTATLTHADYVAAAKKCITLENEINTILVNHPELAVELDVEIERMRLEKERLEQERDRMILEKNILEEQLRQAGIDPNSIASVSMNSMKHVNHNNNSSTISQSVDEVLRESFTKLFDRVGADIQMVMRMIRYGIQPTIGPIQLVWKYISPTIDGIIQKIFLLFDTIISKQQVQLIRETMVLQYNTAIKISSVVIEPIISIIKSIQSILYQRKDVQQVIRIIDAFVGPLCHSIYTGWKVIEPDVSNITSNVISYIQHLRHDMNTNTVNSLT